MWNFIQALTLSINDVRLEPLNMTHELGLREAVQDGELWQLVFTFAPTADAVADYIRHAEKTRCAFAVIDEKQNKIVGTTSFCDINPAIPRLEIGHTWYAQSVWRSPSCKYLMMRHAFDTLGCYAVAWQTDILNKRSQQAIEHLGAKKDGILRGCVIRRDGSIRDSVMYSMLQSEWHQAKTVLEQKLGL